MTTDGKLLTEYVKEPLPVLVKLLDSYSRLMIQVHPDDARAAKYFHSDKGKAESWHILGTRTIHGEEPYVYLGFKKGITKEKWRLLYEKQDVKGMEECLHKIPVKVEIPFLFREEYHMQWEEECILRKYNSQLILR